MEAKSKKARISSYQKFIRLGKWVGLAVVGVWVMYWILVEVIGDTVSTQGQFGDQFGGINALFTGLAFAGVIVTIILQSEELHLQRRELRLTRKELKLARAEQELTRAEFNKQNETLRRQQFEGAFFNVFNLRNKQLETFGGAAIFMEYANELSVRIMMINYTDENDYPNFKYKYHEFYEVIPRRFILDTYFLNLTALLQIVDNSSLISEGEKTYYISLVFSLLTYYEKRIIFYHIPLCTRSVSAANDILYDLDRRYHISDSYLSDPWFDGTHRAFIYFDRSKNKYAD